MIGKEMLKMRVRVMIAPILLYQSGVKSLYFPKNKKLISFK